MESFTNAPSQSFEEQEAEQKLNTLLEFRFEQSRASRLAEYITGMRPDDPKMVERLMEDQKIIRAKYNLPDQNITYADPNEYERFLRGIARKADARIRDKSECGTFFEEVPSAGGVFLGENKVVGVSLNKETDETFSRSLGILEHEVIHALQAHNNPGMPIELMEYEAYIAGLSMDAVSKNPENIEWVVFKFFIGNSVNQHYKSTEDHTEKKSENNPAWDSPEYFLRNIDNIDQKIIDDYRLKHAEFKDGDQTEQKSADEI